MSAAQPVIKRLDHLGLIAAFCHEVGLPGIIDRIIPVERGFRFLKS